jgi:hypothetical protein
VIGKTYDIHYASGKPLEEDDLGEFDPALQKIIVRKGQPLETEQDTLLHEVIHAIDSELNLNLSEKQVRGSATGLLAVLKDNPKFYSYLRRKK